MASTVTKIPSYGTSEFFTEEDANRVVEKMRSDPRHSLRIDDDKSGYFADGSHIARISRLPKAPFLLPGSWFKLLACDWKHDMYVMILNVPGGVPVDSHYHIAEAHGYIFTGAPEGAFEYEYGVVFAGEYMAEAPDIEHIAAIGPEDVLQLSIVYGGLAASIPGGGAPDLSTYYGCMEVYEAAKAVGGADHIIPPPEGWYSTHLREAQKRFGHLQPVAA